MMHPEIAAPLLQAFAQLEGASSALEVVASTSALLAVFALALHLLGFDFD